ncbi:MAG: YdcF family protein [Verrucomicrobia bacterium]|nr:YdcF family protein [Verrucomicrobiota bacterium]
MNSEKISTAPPSAKARSPFVRWLRRIALALAALSLGVLLAWQGAPWLLNAESSAARAEVIVVLGGETPHRAERAAELFRRGAAPRIIVTGAGDAAIIRRYLVQAGVPAEVIALEEKSVSTRENAEFTAPLLKQLGARDVFLVTSWFHTRRALATFRHEMPDVRFFPVPARYSWAAYASPHWEEFKGVYREYGKSAWYLMRHGIWPFVCAE